LSLLNILNRTSADQSTSLERLSTGSRINSGKDNPAGLIALSSLNSELTNVNASITNNQRTDSILSVADKALDEVTSLLDEVQSLALSSANQDGISGAEIAANQAQIDNALEAIDRIIGSTEFNGKKLLDGSLGITTTGVDTTKLTDVRVFNRPSSSADLTVSVTGAASQATHDLATAVATADATISVQGKDGTATFDILSGEALTSVAAKINSGTAQTGVTAAVTSGTLTLTSSDYGTDAFVRVSTVQGQQAAITDGEDFGANAVVTVNGQAVAVDGKDVHYQSNGVSASFTLTDGYNDGTITGNEVFTISGGGATFQLGTTANSRATVGISGLYTQQLGSASGGYLSTLRGGGSNSLVNDATSAAQIAAKAKSQIAQVQGRIGGFQKFQVATAINQQTASKESLTSAISVIQDVDYAEETANLSRQNVLLQSAISLLGVANQQSSQVLSLLR
jgi:flagellin